MLSYTFIYNKQRTETPPYILKHSPFVHEENSKEKNEVHHEVGHVTVALVLVSALLVFGLKGVREGLIEDAHVLRVRRTPPGAGRAMPRPGPVSSCTARCQQQA